MFASVRDDALQGKGCYAKILYGYKNATSSGWGL